MRGIFRIKEWLLLIWLIGAVLFVAACTDQKIIKGLNPAEQVSQQQEQVYTEDLELALGEELKTSATLAEKGFNEVGKIMILMYHVIGADQEGDWKQTSENFRRDLDTLYREGYYLTDLMDYVDNNISVPAGKTPVILTFDDSTAGQFRYLIKEDGTLELDPECAVGILLDFAGRNPDFGCAATFYINSEPFGQRRYWQEKLQKLVEWGFSIGNHTFTHQKLNKLDAVGVQKEIALIAKAVEEAVPGYKIRSFSLPYGISPQDKKLVQRGEYSGYEYENSAVLRVGAAPGSSPNTIGYDSLALPRVQASSIELEKWLNYFRDNPTEKYISDGDPEIITIPESKSEMLDEQRIQGKKVQTY